ncbi:hypothetical protein E3N88_29267 [Mikania micrantha]|uniref:Uncharacterized protein n=1 Tax=Mikania micrantha TaxID=192012 RepID=A0A5N6ML82_9ASTR|nr:hypothetical protein E3N88_29255 [Mikania micrantha]KAD3640044.1 hypothetical protein E3N88_29267 [Mikania micrantha]
MVGHVTTQVLQVMLGMWWWQDGTAMLGMEAEIGKDDEVFVGPLPLVVLNVVAFANDRKTRLSRSPFQEFTNLLAKPTTKAITYVEDVAGQKSTGSNT